MAHKVFSSIKRLAPFFIFSIAVLIRLYTIRFFPGNVDEIKLAEEMVNIYWHAIPVHFVGFGWGENVLLAFIAWPLTFVLGLQPLIALRLVTLISNVFLLYWIYLIASRCFDRRTALVALTFAAIWPWSVIAGSIAFNAFTAATLIAWGAYLLIVALHSERPRLSYFAALLFAASCYGFILSFIWIAIILITLFVIYKKKWLQIHYATSLTLLLCMVLPISLFYLSLQLSWLNFDQFLWFNFPALTSSRITDSSVIRQSAWGSGLLQIASNYLTHFYFVILAWTPGKSSSFTWMYLAYIWDALFIYIGVYSLMKQWKSYYWLVLALLLFPVGASFTFSDIGYSATRDAIGLPILILISAFGARSLFPRRDGRYL